MFRGLSQIWITPFADIPSRRFLANSTSFPLPPLQRQYSSLTIKPSFGEFQIPVCKLRKVRPRVLFLTCKPVYHTVKQFEGVLFSALEEGGRNGGENFC
jgi:hypothetical protein